MSKEPMHPIQKICSNCEIMRNALLKTAQEYKIKLNTVPHDCPVARELTTVCSTMGFLPQTIKKLHHTVNFIRAEQ